MSATHTLFYAAASPFVRKVLVLLHETGQRERVALEEVTPTPVAPIRQLNASNPAGKIPALRLPDGQVLHDSRVICDYFDQQHVGEPLIPREGSARWRRLTIASLADAVLDAAVLSRYETFVRPEEKRWDTWLEAQREKDRAVPGVAGGRLHRRTAGALRHRRHRRRLRPGLSRPAPAGVGLARPLPATRRLVRRSQPAPVDAGHPRLTPRPADACCRRRRSARCSQAAEGPGNSRPIRAARRSPSRRSSRRPT